MERRKRPYAPGCRVMSEERKNLRLAAADLLAACEQALELIGDLSSLDEKASDVWNTLEAAVTKAKGQS